jgi:four helix bundle protein
MAKRVDDLPVFQKAQQFVRAVDAILALPTVRRNRRLWTQLDDANDSITSNMREGFQQSSDTGFAHYLNYSKGSVEEVVGWLQRGMEKGHISDNQLSPLREAGEALAKMLGGFIKYLRRSGFKNRGSHCKDS